MSKKTVLTATERKELSTWDPDFLYLPVHGPLQHQMNLCMDGVENAIVIGPRGPGKSYSVKWFKEEIEALEAEEFIQNPDYIPREVLSYQTSTANGTKTALIDLYAKLFGGGMSKAALRFHTAQSLRDQIVDEILRRRISLICIDEAQMISAGNLDLLRQVTDGAADSSHPLGLLLIGNEGLRESLVEIQQLGQRFSAEIRFPPFTQQTVGPHLPGFHPHIARLKDTMGEKEWRRLESDLFAAVRGAFRRLMVILRNANALALRFDRPIDEPILRSAIEKLSDEV
jgi:hypothetical protein